MCPQGLSGQLGHTCADDSAPCLKQQQLTLCQPQRKNKEDVVGWSGPTHGTRGAGHQQQAHLTEACGYSWLACMAGTALLAPHSRSPAGSSTRTYPRDRTPASVG